jgi:hypothetical protein
VLEVDDVALVVGVWSFDGTGPDGEPVRLEARNADVLRRQPDGTWRFVIDKPWGVDRAPARPQASAGAGAPTRSPEPRGIGERLKPLAAR